MHEPEYQDFSRLLRTAHKAIKEATGIEYLTLVQEEHSIHFHVWFFPWTQAVIEGYGQPSLAKIREIMADYRRQPVDEVEWQALKISIEKINRRWQDS